MNSFLSSVLMKKKKKKEKRMNLFIAIYLTPLWSFPNSSFNKPPSQVSSLLPSLLWKVIGDNEL